MSIADIIISLVIWIFQKIILPVMPVNIPFFSFATWQGILSGSMKHNFIYGLAGLNQFMNLELIFTLIAVIIYAEILFWTIKAGFFFVKLIRGGG